jgi:putative endonuclease
MAGYIYMLRCADGSYYTGSTANLEYRLSEHQAGEGGSYTAARLPVKLVYTEEFPTLHDAFQFECQVKGWSRRKKEALIRWDYAALPDLARSRTGKSRARPSTSSG